MKRGVGRLGFLGFEFSLTKLSLKFHISYTLGPKNFKLPSLNPI
jgi:hypothetical protein